MAFSIYFVGPETHILGGCVCDQYGGCSPARDALRCPWSSLSRSAVGTLPSRIHSAERTEARHHTNSNGNTALFSDTASNKDAVVHTQDSQCTEMSTPPAPSTDGVDAKIDVNGHREVPIAQTKDCPPPQTTKDHNEPGWIVEDTNSKNTVPQNTPKNNGMTAVTVNGDDHATFTLAPLPLTNGHHKDTSTPIDTNLFDDVWSPATKLKRRLEDTTDLIVCPGVYDGFSARIALAVGFDAMYMVWSTLILSRFWRDDGVRQVLEPLLQGWAWQI